MIDILPQKYFRSLNKEENKFRFLIAHLLVKSHTCFLFRIKRLNYILQFSPTSFAKRLWINKHLILSDEVFIQDYLKLGDFFVDIGGNIGTHALLAASIVGYNGKVITFEAHPRTYKYLNKNILLNNFHNVITHNFALGDKSGFLKFSDTSYDDSTNHVETTNVNGIQVEVKILDDICSTDKIDLIKVDVEGYEKFVFQGGIKTLKNTQCIIFESSKRNFDRYDYSTQTIIDLLHQNDFSIFGIIKFKKTIYPLVEKHISYSTENLIAIKDIDKFVKRTSYSIEEIS